MLSSSLPRGRGPKHLQHDRQSNFEKKKKKGHLPSKIREKGNQVAYLIEEGPIVRRRTEQPWRVGGENCGKILYRKGNLRK